jgi:ring-1,2-phenylacetyl-CoA epoxidase subunit PaaC
MSARFHFLLRMGDSALVLGHRLSEWCGHAPTLEEDIALSNIALDLLGHARGWLQYAAECEGAGRDEDDLAFFRGAREYRNLLLCEQPNGDFARTMMRQFLFDAHYSAHCAALADSADAGIKALAAIARRECAYHLRHSAAWMERLGDGTAHSRRRVKAALEELWPYTGELFSPGDGERGLAAQGVIADEAALEPVWRKTVGDVFLRARLKMPAQTGAQRGGKSGFHSEHLGHLLAEMQSVPRALPQASW